MNKLHLSTTDFNCINRVLKEFLKSKEKSIYDFSYYEELQNKVQVEILKNKETLDNLIEVKNLEEFGVSR